MILKIVPRIKQLMTPNGAIPSHESNPIPRNVPPSVGAKALHVVSSAVNNNNIGAESGCCVWLES